MLDNLILVCGTGKDGKKWYAIKITDEFASGKHYTAMQFISEITFNKLASTEKFKVVIK